MVQGREEISNSTKQKKMQFISEAKVMRERQKKRRNQTLRTEGESRRTNGISNEVQRERQQLEEDAFLYYHRERETKYEEDDDDEEETIFGDRGGFYSRCNFYEVCYNIII